jgi:hypothetical protein
LKQGLDVEKIVVPPSFASTDVTADSIEIRAIEKYCFPVVVDYTMGRWSLRRRVVTEAAEVATLSGNPRLSK